MCHLVLVAALKEFRFQNVICFYIKAPTIASLKLHQQTGCHIVRGATNVSRALKDSTDALILVPGFTYLLTEVETSTWWHKVRKAAKGLNR